MDHEPRSADDLPDEAELSGPLRDAIGQIRGDDPSAAALARVLQRARQIAAEPQTDTTLPLPHKAVPFPRRNRMFTFLFRGLAAATTAAALIGAWLYHQESPTAAADLARC